MYPKLKFTVIYPVNALGKVIRTCFPFFVSIAEAGTGFPKGSAILTKDTESGAGLKFETGPLVV